MSLLTNDIVNYIDSRPWPKRLDYSIRDAGSELRLVFFRDNWLTLTPEDHILIVSLVKEVIEKIRKDGVPIVFNRIESRRA